MTWELVNQASFCDLSRANSLNSRYISKSVICICTTFRQISDVSRVFNSFDFEVVVVDMINFGILLNFLMFQGFDNYI